MDLKIGTKLHGFTCTNIRDCLEVNGRLVEMVHDETGALLCWADNGEQNKLFAVGLKTIPEDDTGVFHILEHSVLCGSEKYPVKEPFVELLKSSMNTFLNAMTFSDKTLYPVSSRNDRDFLNLTDVYLDAVFAPNILKNANIFYQEGHHIAEKDGAMIFNGVVFNEMKGAMANADEAIGQKLLSILYPESCYGYNSGGDPEKIPLLSYEQFLDTYRRFYHPSNARFYLDGAVPLEETLKAINVCISGRGKRDDIPEIVMQSPVSASEEWKFEIGDNESKADRTRFTLGKLFRTWRDRTAIMAVNILADVLTGSNEALLTRAVLESGLAQDVDIDIEGGIAQPYVLLDIKNITDGKTGEIKALITETIQRIVKEGIDRSLLKASLNRYEFRAREPKEPAALLRCINAFNTWLYGGDPIDGIAYEQNFAKLNEMIENRGFELLLEELFLDNAGKCELVSYPSYSLSKQRDEAEKVRIEKVTAAWTDSERENNAKLCEELKQWQETPDTSEAIATIPKLDLSEVDPEPEKTATEITECDGVKVLWHEIPCNGIVHLSLYFKITDKRIEELPQLSMLENLLGVLGTEKYSPADIERELKTRVGRMTVQLKVFANRENTELCIPMLAVNCSVLEENLEPAKDLLKDILLNTKFDDVDRVREILLQLNDYSRENGPAAGHSIARICTMAHYSSELAAMEAVTGYTAAKWLREMAKNPAEGARRVCEYLSGVMQDMITRSRLTIGITSTNPVNIEKLIEAFPKGSAVPEYAAYKTELPERMGIRIPAQIAYSAQSHRDEGYTGALRVAANILSLDYLWNVVRVRGGAYGTGISAGRNGIVSSYSYRDPDPRNAFRANMGAAEYLREFCGSDADIDKYIISAIGNTEPLLSPGRRGIREDDDYFEGYMIEHRRKVRAEMLGTNAEELMKCANRIEAFAKNGDICIVADARILEKFPELTVVDW